MFAGNSVLRAGQTCQGLCTVTVWYGCTGAIVRVPYPYRQRVPSILDHMGPIRVPENGQISEFF